MFSTICELWVADVLILGLVHIATSKGNRGCLKRTAGSQHLVRGAALLTKDPERCPSSETKTIKLVIIWFSNHVVFRKTTHF